MNNGAAAQKGGGDPEARDIVAEWYAQDAEARASWNAQLARARETVARLRGREQSPPDLNDLNRQAEQMPDPGAIRTDEGAESPKSPKLEDLDSMPCAPVKASTGDLELDAKLDELTGPTSTKGLAANPASSEHKASRDLNLEKPGCASAEVSMPSEPAHVTPGPMAADAVASVVMPSVSVSSLDEFPVAGLGDLPEFDDPGRELVALFRELVLHKDYPAVRTRCCQLSFRLNLIGAVAPAFRDWPRGVAPFGAAINTLITRDQIVIDYHWCHAKRMPLSPTDDVHKHLLDLDTDFDFKMAWELSGQRRKAEYRGGEALCLTLLQQCQTIQLRGRELNERMDHILTGYRMSKAKSHSRLAKATAAIGAWINGKPRFKSQRISYERLWMARELLGPGASNHSIAELHGLMLGAQPLDRRTIAGKLETLGKVVDAVLETVSTP